MIGVIKKEQKDSIQDVQQLAMMVEPVITQKLGMDLQLVVNLVKSRKGILKSGANNYFRLIIIKSKSSRITDTKFVSLQLTG